MKEPEFKYFAGKQGSGYILPSKEFPGLIAQTLALGNEVLKPGDDTSIGNHLGRAVTYLGCRERNEMIFYMGECHNRRHYFQSIFWVSRTRIYEHFHPQHGRDFNFVNGVWK